MEKQIEEFSNDIQEATRRASEILVEETKAFVKEHHRYHSIDDFNKAHTKTLHELEAEYLIEKGYRKVEQGEWVIHNALPLSRQCKNCKSWYTKHSINEYDYSFCPHCGADMRKGN